MTPAQKAAAFNAERARQLPRLSRIQQDAVREVLRQLADAARAVDELLAAVPEGAPRRRLEALQADIARTLDELRGTSARVGSNAMGSAWSAGTELIALPLAAGGIRIATHINARALTALQASLTGFIGDASLRTINRINAEIAQTMIGVRPQHEAISNVQRWLKSERQRAITIVNDEIGRSYSAASQSAMEDVSERLPGLRKRWIKSGKRTPRPDHVATHGQLRLVKEPFIIGGRMQGELVVGDGPRLMYPRDPSAPLGQIINCGCLSIPVTDGSTWGASRVMLDPLDASHVPMTVIRDPDQ